jgi:hypothetical protein
VLNFLDKEFRKFQDKEESWELEKSELKSEISSLKEKNLKYENLQIDLLKRIKMLEFSLRNERNKNKSENDSGNSKTQIPSKFTQNQLKPVALLQSFQSKTSVASETLRKFFFIFFNISTHRYLQELSCSEVWSLISKPSNVVANSLGVQEIDISVTSTNTSTESSSAKRSLQEEDFGATVKLSSSLKTPKKAEITDDDFEKMSDEELTKRV